MLFTSITLNAFWMEIFWAISSRAFSNLIFSFVFRSYLLLFCPWFSSFIFLGLLILNSIITSLLLADKTWNKVTLAIIASPINSHCLFKALLVSTKLWNFEFASYFVNWQNILLLDFLSTLGMEYSFTKAFTMECAFRMLTKWTQFLKHFFFLLIIRKLQFVITNIINLQFWPLLININISTIFWLNLCNILFIHYLFINLKILDCHFLKSPWRFTDLLEPDTC